MNKVEQWFLRYIIKRECIQGFDHPERITNLYKEIRIACKNEFTEDNVPTLNHSLREWFEKSLR